MERIIVKWQTKEMRFLRKHGKDYTIAELADMLGRSKSSVRHFMMHNNIPYKHERIMNQEEKTMAEVTEETDMILKSTNAEE